MADDDEYQARVLEAEEEQDEPQRTGTKRPPLRKWSPDEELQAVLVDGFNKLIAAQSGKKSKQPKPTPRPETGRERAKRAMDSATVTELFEAFTPGR